MDKFTATHKCSNCNTEYDNKRLKAALGYIVRSGEICAACGRGEIQVIKPVQDAK